MSFRAQDLSVLAYANGFTHWHYRTEDPLPVLLASYFAGAAELFRPGDQITATLLRPCCVDSGSVDSGRADLASLVVTALPDAAAPEIALLATSLAPPAPTLALVA